MNQSRFSGAEQGWARPASRVLLPLGSDTRAGAANKAVHSKARLCDGAESCREDGTHHLSRRGSAGGDAAGLFVLLLGRLED